MLVMFALDGVEVTHKAFGLACDPAMQRRNALGSAPQEEHIFEQAFAHKVVWVRSPKRWRVTADLPYEISPRVIFGFGGCWSTCPHAMLRCFSVRKKGGRVIWPKGCKSFPRAPGIMIPGIGAVS